MKKVNLISFVLFLIALFAMVVQNVPAARTLVLQTASVAHGAAPLVTAVAKRPKPIIPSGSETYQITEASGAGPHIVQATINPPDVHLGDKQNFTVIISSAAALDSVAALVETDHGTTTVELKSAGLAQKGDVLPARYAINDTGNLVPASELAVNGGGNLFERLASYVFGHPRTSSAASSVPAKQYRYEGSWIVRDTHNIVYHTTFVARDVAGKSDAVTLAWSDACSIPQSGAWTISSACTESSLDGVDRGNVTITGYTLTLNAGVKFAFTPGYKITIGTNGKIVIAAGASVVKGYLSYLDADGDGYPANGALVFSTTTPGTSYVLRGNETNYGSIDCNDNSNIQYENLTEYYDGDGDGYGIASNSQSFCGSSQSTPDLHYAWNSGDCYDSNGNAYPGSSYASGVNRGDGSFDYNCDGLQTLISIQFASVTYWQGSGSSCSSMSAFPGGNNLPAYGNSLSCVITGNSSSYSMTCSGTGSSGVACGINIGYIDSAGSPLGTYPNCSITSSGGASIKLPCY